MSSITATKTFDRLRDVSAWWPLLVLPTAVALSCAGLPPWIFMWALALSIYAGCKWLSLASCPHDERASAFRRVSYLILWPGMDARAFLGHGCANVPASSEWLLAFAKLVLGSALVVAAVRMVNGHPHVAAWSGMAGIVLVLHFGIFHVLSLWWRHQGVDARPIMHAPIMASSLAEFWGRRWNVAFRDLAHSFVFRPLVCRLGIAGAMMAGFIVSGLAHDLVISIPARGGYGLPTIYFVLQGLGMLMERNNLAKRVGLGRGGIVGWLFCMTVTVAPLCLLIHPLFVKRVVIPMLVAWRAAAFAAPAIPPASLIFVGGLLHFGILLASALVPRVLDWKTSLGKLDRLSRQLIWVHGLFIVLTIIAFGALSVFFSCELVSGTRLARAVCLSIACFWATRLAIQLFVFDATPYLRSAFLKVGYHGLTAVFTYLACAYSWAAMAR